MMDDAGNSDRDDLQIHPIYIIEDEIKVDVVTLAKETEFEVEVTRYKVNNRFPDALIFSALIEEIIQLKEALNKIRGEK